MGIACVTSLNQLGHTKKFKPLRFKFIIDGKKQARTCMECKVTTHGRPKKCPCCNSTKLVNARNLQ